MKKGGSDDRFPLDGLRSLGGRRAGIASSRRQRPRDRPGVVSTRPLPIRSPGNESTRWSPALGAESIPVNRARPTGSRRWEGRRRGGRLSRGSRFVSTAPHPERCPTFPRRDPVPTGSRSGPHVTTDDLHHSNRRAGNAGGARSRPEREPKRARIRRSTPERATASRAALRTASGLRPRWTAECQEAGQVSSPQPRGWTARAEAQTGREGASRPRAEPAPATTSPRTRARSSITNGFASQPQNPFSV